MLSLGASWEVGHYWNRHGDWYLLGISLYWTNVLCVHPHSNCTVSAGLFWVLFGVPCGNIMISVYFCRPKFMCRCVLFKHILLLDVHAFKSWFRFPGFWSLQICEWFTQRYYLQVWSSAHITMQVVSYGLPAVVDLNGPPWSGQANL